jgi:magnesium transporter
MRRHRRRAETAADHLVKQVPLGRPHETAATAVATLGGAKLGCTESLFVVDGEQRLLGAIRMRDLLCAPSGSRLDSLMGPATTVHPGTDQEHVASHALHHGLTAVPVADGDGRLLGVVPPEALLQVLRREHVEDLHRLAGISREGRQARAALEEPPARRTRHRLPWLLVGLAGSTLAAMVMARFERVLDAQIAVAFFIPGIVYLADAVGTQTEAVAVRGLSLTALPLRRMIWGEVRTGALIGLLLGACSLAAVLAAFRNLSLAVTVATTVLVSSSVATTVGVGFPALLARLGRDPAFGSGPLATIVQDVLTLLIYFLIASALL